MLTTNSIILVTGGSGFVGSYLIEELVSRGYPLRAMRRRKTVPFYIDPQIMDKVEWIGGDIMDTGFLEEAMQNVDAVIHAAAHVSFGDEHPAEMLRTNIEGTANVVNAALENNMRRFVHVSSVAAFGSTRNITITEGQKWEESRQNTHYAISKYHGEMEVWRGIAEGLNAVIVNPSTILGYGDWNTSSNAIFKAAYRGFPWYTNGINGFVDVRDVARATVDLLEGTVSAERFILNSENWSFRRLLDALSAAFGKKKPYLLATPFLSGIAWRLEKLRSVVTGNPGLITRESAKVATRHTEYDNSKILQALPGFSFRPLRETIMEACSMYLERLQK